MAHIDVMDNHFVPNLTFGPPVVERIRAISPIPLDAHLMIADADRNAPVYAEIGCASVTFHAEAAAAPVRLARELRKLGAKASLALKPATPIEPFIDLLGEFDQILIMTVEPGFGGQKFLDLCLPKIRRTRQAISASGLEIRLQVDEGSVRVDDRPCASTPAPTSSSPVPAVYEPRIRRGDQPTAHPRRSLHPPTAPGRPPRPTLSGDRRSDCSTR